MRRLLDLASSFLFDLAAGFVLGLASSFLFDLAPGAFLGLASGFILGLAPSVFLSLTAGLFLCLAPRFPLGHPPRLLVDLRDPHFGVLRRTFPPLAPGPYLGAQFLVPARSLITRLIDSAVRLRR
ncbi:MAG: hypothetical protein IPK39_04540 [Sulfuritalea sp.]|nr:hypothetical protein [Sulfuritalea sp.]